MEKVVQLVAEFVSRREVPLAPGHARVEAEASRRLETTCQANTLTYLF